MGSARQRARCREAGRSRRQRTTHPPKHTSHRFRAQARPGRHTEGRGGGSARRRPDVNLPAAVQRRHRSGHKRRSALDSRWTRFPGPNELKLSDRGWLRKARQRKRLAASLCSLERVVRPPAYRGPLDCRNGGRRLRRGNDGRCRRKSVNEGTGWPEGKTCRQDGPSGNWRVLARTRNHLDTGKRGNGNTPTLENPTALDCWPNGLKLSDRGWREEA